MLLLYVLTGVVGAPLMARLATRISKHRAVAGRALGFSCTIACGSSWAGWLLAGALTWKVVPSAPGPAATLTQAMVADISDEVRLETGKERAGLLYAMTTLTQKIPGRARSPSAILRAGPSVGFEPKLRLANTPAANPGPTREHGHRAAVMFCLLGAVSLIGYTAQPREAH